MVPIFMSIAASAPLERAEGSNMYSFKGHCAKAAIQEARWLPCSSTVVKYGRSSSKSRYNTIGDTGLVSGCQDFCFKFKTQGVETTNNFILLRLASPRVFPVKVCSISHVRASRLTDLDFLDVAVPEKAVAKPTVTPPVGGVVAGPRSRHVVVL